ncbi:MAG TPA: non-homologous end-joining DNA ligase [Allosphingosinicella sp.]|nr:non-homologous end-joining DNA ligase [Allosphingosinicella sp.]
MSRFTEPVYPRPDLPPIEAIAQYYRAVGPLILPFLARRPLNLYRCSGERCFFQRNRDHPPTGEGFFRAPIRQLPIEQKNGRTEAYLYVEDLAGLLACVEAKAVEFHAWGCRAGDVERPDRIAIDLDPGEGIGFAEVREGALQVRQSLAAIGLESWPLLTGGKGVHVVVPIRPEAQWDEARAFASRFCAALAGLLPDRFTVALPKKERTGRIFLDYLRNQRTATAIMPWSLRAREGAPVATPLSWSEFAKAQSPVAMTYADAGEARQRALKLRGWGRSDQSLPRI